MSVDLLLKSSFGEPSPFRSIQSSLQRHLDRGKSSGGFVAISMVFLQLNKYLWSMMYHQGKVRTGEKSRQGYDRSGSKDSHAPQPITRSMTIVVFHLSRIVWGQQETWCIRSDVKMTQKQN